ncbi:MAG: methyltransferase [Myxococcales bacterium]|nr:methyltransferase [Myxococcales bacterium]
MVDLPRLLLRPLANRIAKPVIKRYLRRSVWVRAHGLLLEVPPGVFHPGLFFSSGVMARWLATQSLEGKHLLDVGTGSGVLGLVAARRGAHVTLLDLSPRALLTAQRNAQRNRLRVRAVHSDALSQVPTDALFDWIIANPPWFPKAAPDEAGLAWYSGPEHEWFHNFFGQFQGLLRPGGCAILVLADSADLHVIADLAADYDLRLATLHTERVLWETQHILAVETR